MWNYHSFIYHHCFPSTPHPPPDTHRHTFTVSLSLSLLKSILYSEPFFKVWQEPIHWKKNVTIPWVTLPHKISRLNMKTAPACRDEGFGHDGPLNSNYLLNSHSGGLRIGHRFQSWFRSTQWLPVAVTMRYWKTWRLLVRTYRHLPAAGVASLVCSPISILQPFVKAGFENWKHFPIFSNSFAHLVAKHKPGNYIDPPMYALIKSLLLQNMMQRAHAHTHTHWRWW